MGYYPLRVTLDDTVGEQRLARIRGRFANFQPVMATSVRALVRRAVVEQFRTRGAWGGHPWAALADSTVRRKRAAGVLRKGPLKFTGKLYESLTVYGHPLRREVVTKDGYLLKSLRTSKKGYPIGAAHQTGAPSRGLPERQIFADPMPASFLAELRNLVRGYVIAGQFGNSRGGVGVPV